MNHNFTSSESHNTEYKSSWHDDYLKWICGFANAIDGMIFICKDDRGKTVGLKNYATIQMRVYDDRLSIWNEGALPYGLSLEDLKKEHSSRPRNPLLANACFLGGYIDAWGRGTLKIINACKDAGMSEPEIVEKNGGVSMTLFVQSPENNSSEKDVGEKRGEKLSENRQRILDAMREDPGISQVKLVEIVGIGSTNIEKNIQYLKDHGYIRRIGPAKGGYWEVNND